MHEFDDETTRGAGSLNTLEPHDQFGYERSHIGFNDVLDKWLWLIVVPLAGLWGAANLWGPL